MYKLFSNSIPTRNFRQRNYDVEGLIDDMILYFEKGQNPSIRLYETDTDDCVITLVNLEYDYHKKYIDRFVFDETNTVKGTHRTTRYSLTGLVNRLELYKDTLELGFQPITSCDVGVSKYREGQDIEDVYGSSQNTTITFRGSWNGFLDEIESKTEFKVDSAYRRRPDDWIELIGPDGAVYDAEVTRYHNGDYELHLDNISPSYQTQVSSSTKQPVKSWYVGEPETPMWYRGGNVDLEDIVDVDRLNEIAERYNTSYPVSGDWSTETEHELNAIAQEFKLPRQLAKKVMIDWLGFDPEDF